MAAPAAPWSAACGGATTTAGATAFAGPLRHRGDHLMLLQLQLLALATQIQSHEMAQVFWGDLTAQLQLERGGP